MVVIGFGIFSLSNSSQAEPTTGTCLAISKGGTGCDSAAMVDYIKQDLINTLYPIGSILTSTNSTNPGDYLGGTWEAFGQGRTLLGVGSNTANTTNDYGAANAGVINRTVSEEMGGEMSHTLTVAEMPSHTHGLKILNLYYTAGGVNAQAIHAPIPAMSGNTVTGASGGGSDHNNVQMYITVFFWKRVS